MRSFYQDRLGTTIGKALKNRPFSQSYADMGAAAGRSWVWQTCNEFGYFQVRKVEEETQKTVFAHDFFLGQHDGLPRQA